MNINKYKSTDTGEFKNGDQIEVRHVCTPDIPSRFGTYENGGIHVNEHWFQWDYFFKVNFIVNQN